MGSQNSKPVVEFEVGTYSDLQKRSVVGDGYDIHHNIQIATDKNFVPGYDENNGVYMVLRKSYHQHIRNLNRTQMEERDNGKTARQILTNDIWRNRKILSRMPDKDKVAFNQALRQAIELHYMSYPNVYEKPPQHDEKYSTLIIDSGVNLLASQINLNTSSNTSSDTPNVSARGDQVLYFSTAGAPGHGGGGVCSRCGAGSHTASTTSSGQK